MNPDPGIDIAVRPAAVADADSLARIYNFYVKETIVTFEEDEGAYNQSDAGGFIKLNALRLRIAAAKRARPVSRKRS